MDENSYKAITNIFVCIVAVVLLTSSCQMHRQYQRTLQTKACLEQQRVSAYDCKIIIGDYSVLPERE